MTYSTNTKDQQDPSKHGDAILVSSFLTIWFRPRNTIRNIINNNSEYAVFSIVAIRAMTPFFVLWLGTVNYGSTFLGYIPVVIGVSLIWLYLESFFFKLIGGWLKGTANSKELRAAIAWGEIPAIPGIILVSIGLLGNTFALNIAYLFSIWTLISLLLCISEVHRYSIIKALLTYIGSYATIILPTAFITFLIHTFAK